MILKFLTNLGFAFSSFIIFVLVMFVYFGSGRFGLFITWRCGLCGKLNETNVIKYFLCMCDHMGDMN